MSTPAERRQRQRKGDPTIYDNITDERREMESKEALSIRSEHTLRSENLPFDIDVWYPLLKEHTFPTYFLPLSVKEARAILNMYQTSILRRKWLRPEDVDTLRNLEDRIGLLMNKHFQGKSAFMRLCGRSPKDADPLNHQQVMESYYSWMEKLVAEGYSTKDPNTHFMAFVKFNWMKVTTAVEVMNLLLTSERVHIDMDDWLRCNDELPHPSPSSLPPPHRKSSGSHLPQYHVTLTIMFYVCDWSH
eukprot:TRINITY_DN6143_c0_g1_i3.p1 TRINITY_DN6143_c0_g1~~TRINITY_DN6143_c0_g1_i3.p1  ORF type:complete len:266 (+),score=40.32 TRINITY_DN6143_c0_g1_i3:61-798(+)